MAEFTLKEFENLNLYSNDSLQKVVASVVNSSSNAVLVNMYEDSLILLDHDEGQFYIADYDFNPKELKIKIENFEAVELREEEDNFKDKIYEYFDDEEGNPVELAEVYKESVMGQERYVAELINGAIATKDFSEVDDWSQVKNVIDENAIDELRKDKSFKAYEERLETHPLTEVKMFDWENPVNVSLIETESSSIVNRTTIEKANELWKKENFKESFEEAAKVLLDDVEEGTERFRSLLEDYPQIFYLDSGDRKTLFGKAILASKDLRDDMSLLVKGLDMLFEQFDLAEMREEYLAEADEEEMNGDEGDEGGKEDKEDKKEKAPEVEPISMKKIASELKSVAEKVEDEDLKKKLENLIARVEKGKEEGTRPDVVKEAVAILTL
jgi:hypothetical protein